jgi:hypothetical protein
MCFSSLKARHHYQRDLHDIDEEALLSRGSAALTLSHPEHFLVLHPQEEASILLAPSSEAVKRHADQLILIPFSASTLTSRVD